MPVKGRSGKKKRVEAGRPFEGGEIRRNSNKAAGQPRTLKKTVGIPERQDGTIADEGMDMGEELTSRISRAVCRKFLQEQIDHHDGAAVIPGRRRKFCRGCERTVQGGQFCKRGTESAIFEFWAGSLGAKRRKAIAGIQFSSRFCTHELYYRADGRKMRYNVAGVDGAGKTAGAGEHFGKRLRDFLIYEKVTV